MTLPSIERLYEVVEATWPSASRRRVGPWTIREGQGAGSRVSSATAEAPVNAEDLSTAETAMKELGQDRLFMVRAGQTALDDLLSTADYVIKDPVVLYAAPVDILAGSAGSQLIWPADDAVRAVWAEGGIGPARLAVMDRVQGPKVVIAAKVEGQVAGCLFAACYGADAMLHAIDVAPEFRRRGLARDMIRAAANWGREQGVTHVSLVVTDANVGARALYASLGFSPVGHYHYRIKT